ITARSREPTSAVEVTIINSNYHIELNPSEVGSRDRAVIQEIVKEVAQTHTIDPVHQKSFKGGIARGAYDDSCHAVVVLNEVDNLSREAQQALRRTMERYVST